MSTSPTSFVSWRSLGLLGVIALLVLPMTLLIGAPLGEKSLTYERPDETQLFTRGQEPSPAELKVAEKSKVQFYSRPEPTWWPVPGLKGLGAYGHVGMDELRATDTLILPNGKGSIKTRGQGFRQNLPAELRINREAQGGSGRGRYFLVQLAPEAAKNKNIVQIGQDFAKLGAEPIQAFPVNGYLVRVANPKDEAALRAAKGIQFLDELSVSDKVNGLGTRPLRDPERASSDILSVVFQVMPGEDPEDLKSALRRVGANIVQEYPEIAGNFFISAQVRNTRILEVLNEPSVYYAYESPEYHEQVFTHSRVVEMGRLLDPRDFGAFVRPFASAGVDGGGVYTGPAVNFKVAGATGSPIAFSSNLANYAVPPQFLGIADNGLTIDTPSFSHDNANPCLGAGGCADSGGIAGLSNVGVNHRKVEAYTEGDDFDATASGDFLTCDSIRSGGDSHGSIVAGASAGNPSLGVHGLGRMYDDQDTIDQFVTFFNDSGEVLLEMDGQARGARVVFQDIATTPASSPPGCAINFLSDVRAGDVPAARLQNLAFRNDLGAGATLHPRGAKVTLFAFGNPTNFDNNITNGQGTYTNGANSVDAFLFANRRVVHIQAVGNDGSLNSVSPKIDPFVPTDANDVFDSEDIQINDLATAKNIVTVGTVGTDSLRASLDPSETTAVFSSHGPATFASLRGAPLVMAPGVDTGAGIEGREGRYADDYFISEATLVSFDNANDTLGGAAVENIMIQGSAGTSISAGHIAGAALQIRDYFAKGFYPTGAAVTGDRVSDMSGMLVKALLVNSADFSSQGLMSSCAGRGPLVCPSEQGYGKVELANALPLQTYRRERRPPNATNVGPVSNVPQGLLVVDEYFDGGLRGSSSVDGSTTGIGVVPVGGSVSFDFFRRHGADQMRVSLAWYDGGLSGTTVVETETLQNNLDLTVYSGDYELVGGGAGVCSYNGGFFPPACGFCTYAAAGQDNDPAYFDASGQNAHFMRWHGNQFRQFGGQFSLRTECAYSLTGGVCDLDPNSATFEECTNPGAEGFGCNSNDDCDIDVDPAAGVLSADLGANPQNAYDDINTTESVMLHYFGDPGFFGASRDGGDNGPYRARIDFRAAGASPVPDAPCVAAGADNTLTTVPAGNDTTLALASGVGYIGAGTDGLCTTTAAAGDVQLIPTTPGSNFGQPFALAVSGPVFNNRISSVISLDRVAYDCSERVLSMRISDGSVPTTSVASVAANTRVEAVDPNGTVRDTEGGFTMANDAGSAAFRVARASHYNSNQRRVQFVKDRPGALNPIANNGIVEVRDGWTIRAVYDDQTPTVSGGPQPDDAVTTVPVNCRPIIGTVLLGGGSLAPGGTAASVPLENVRKTIITGGCDIGRALNSRGDFFLDAGETVNYVVGAANQNTAQPVNLKGTLSCADPVPGGANPCSFLSIVQPTLELGSIPPGREAIAMWTIKVDVGVKTLATADRAVDFNVTFDSRSTDFGDVLQSQVFTFREALQADMAVLRYNTDFPGGGVQAADYNRDGLIRTVQPGSGARNRELMTLQPLNNAGNPNLTAAGMMPWRFDSNNGGFTAFRAADSKPGGPGSAQNSLAWFYSTTGGCGWQTQNNGVVGSSATLPKGVWHAGHGPVGAFGGGAAACPAYTAPTDPFTVPATEFIADMLQTPILNKVNPGLDARGIPFDVRMEAAGWNLNEEYGDNQTTIVVEVDSNLDDDQPIILGNGYSYRPIFARGGPRTSFANTQRTFGPLRDSDASLAGKVGVNGDEVGVSTPIVSRVEQNFLHRPLLAFPVADVDANTRGFQSNTAVDGATGLPIIPGVCTAGLCTAGGDALIGTPCGTNAVCTGPGTRVGHTTPWGPVRNLELDFGGTYEDFNGASGNRFQMEFQWFVGEGGVGALGHTMDDVYFEWTEQHPDDQSNTSPNDCANIPSRPGANPSARQCGHVSFDRLTLYNCTGGIKVTLDDSTTAGSAGTLGCAAGKVPVNVRSNEEPLGETFCLDPKGGGVFDGVIQTNAVANSPSTLFVGANPGENFFVIASYNDPECDQDNDGELGEGNFRDVDGDGILNFGADGFARDVSKVDFLAEGQGSSDDDNCFVLTTNVDVFNPAGVAQRDNNGDGVVNATDCVASPRTGQCDWDDDGFGDICDNCPTTANNNQLDTDTDGVGNACEDVDQDRDGDLNVADNCPTIYNPSQAGGIRGTFCDDVLDVDGDLVEENLDNCPNEGTDEAGAVVPFSSSYNPDQADSDQDGVGDKCDSEDFDRDGVFNAQDNCKTIYNPADPTFQIQTDSDQDGRGDDRQNLDTLPGAAAYCDPDSDDDNNNGVPDDLVQVATEIDCNYTQFGISNVASAINALGSFGIVSVQLTDDGSADFFCTAGDPDPNNDPIFPQPCTQETPGDPNNDAECDNPGQPGTGVCSAVPDGTADPGELASIRLTIANASTDRQTGGARTLTNSVVGVRPTLPSVACTPKSQVFMGTIGGGATVQTPAGALTFIVDPTPNGPGRSTLARLAEAEFSLAVQADDMEGIPDQRFKFFVDLDRTDKAPIAASCASMPSMNGPGVLCEDFDTNRNGTPGIQWTRLPVSVTAGDPLRANGDPNDDILGWAQGNQPSPQGTNERPCTRSAVSGFIGCNSFTPDENDWHLHSAFEGPGAGYDPLSIPGINSPEGGKAHSGVRSMHMGRHTDAATTLGDTTRHRQVSAFVLDSQGDPNIPGVVIGPNSVLDFWHIVEFPDDEGIGSGFIPPGVSFGGTQVQLSLLGSNGRFERWQVLTPSFNGYDSINQASISICHFEPGDDEIAPANETMCNLAPNWAELGGAIGTDASCATDTDLNDPVHRDCGDVKSCPIPGGGANCTATGAVGPGVWARSAFSLSPFAGRVARVRWVGASGGGWSFGLDRSFLEPFNPQTPIYQYYEQDDGWWIDTIKLTDLRSEPALITPDANIGLATCTAQGNPANCTSIGIAVANSVAFGSRRLVGGDTLLQPVTLDARQSTGDCANGVLQTQWSQLDASGAVVDVIVPFSPSGTVKVAPASDTTYRVEVRCSSDLACAASQDVLVKVYSGEGSDLNLRLDQLGGLVDGLTVTGGATATLSWPARPQPPGISGYDVFRFASGSGTGVDVFTGNTFDGACFANAVPNTALGTNVSTTDAGNPAGGTTFMYQLTHSSTNTAAFNPMGVRPASSNRSGQLVTAGTTCP